jgi:uncharacterized membrane protein
MTQEELLEMARDTANHGTHASGEIIYTFYLEQLEAFAKLVAASTQRTWVGLTNEELTDLFYNTNLGQQSAVSQAVALLKERNS